MSQGTKEVLKGKKFKWSDILSGFNGVKTKEEKERAIMSGMAGNVPYESEMVREWKPPFLFYKFFLYSVVMMFFIFVCSYMYDFGDALLVSIVPYIIPLTMLIFIWELNVPRNIPITDVMFITFFSGIVCYLLIFFMIDITGISYADNSVFTEPLLSVVSRLLLVCIFLRKKSRGYGLNGILIGAAVGAGYSIMETADELFYLAEYAGHISGVMGLIIVRILMVIGGSVLWTASYGGALALAKGRETLKGKHLADSLFLICLIGTYLIEVLWDYDITAFFIRFADSNVAVGLYTFLYVYQGKYILLIVVSWILFLFVARKGMEQVIDIAECARADQKKWDNKIAANYTGKAEVYGVHGEYGGKKITVTAAPVLFGRDSSCAVRFPQDTKGISAAHCEIKKQGKNYVLTDKNSTYGTFWSSGEKLEPGKPYILRDNMEFYLASAENSFKVSVRKEENVLLKDEVKVGRRTNETEGAEESGKNFYIACCVVIAVMFLALYVTSGARAGLSVIGQDDIAGENTAGFCGAWQSDSEYNVKNIILDNIDNLVTTLEIGVFKSSMADGITFTQDGMAYCTYNGVAIDYAKFTYSIVDDSTLHLQWVYDSLDAEISVSSGVEAGISKTIGAETGFDVKYTVDGNSMQLNFAGQNLTLYK